MASQPSQEVQLLLAAEKRASEKVTEARQRKAQRLKRAKEEAAADIEQFKGERQIAFSKYETEHIGSKEDIAKKIDRGTTEKLDTMGKRIHTTRGVILERLIDEVVGTVDVRLHRNKKPTMIASN